MTTEELSRDDIVAQAKSDFAFLDEVASRPVEVDDGTWSTVLAYTVGSITIEVEMDWQVHAVFVLVCRTVDGRRPPGYYMHDGRRMRVHLGEALDGGNEQDRAATRRLQSVTSKSGLDAMATQIREGSAILRERTGRLEDFHAQLFAD